MDKSDICETNEVEATRNISQGCTTNTLSSFFPQEVFHRFMQLNINVHMEMKLSPRLTENTVQQKKQSVPSNRK